MRVKTTAQFQRQIDEKGFDVAAKEMAAKVTGQLCKPHGRPIPADWLDQDIDCCMCGQQEAN